jgi:hypothetical protein
MLAMIADTHPAAGGRLVFGSYFDVRRLGEVEEGFRGLAFGKLGAVEIDAHLDSAFGSTREHLYDWPVSKDSRWGVSDYVSSPSFYVRSGGPICSSSVRLDPFAAAAHRS